MGISFYEMPTSLHAIDYALGSVPPNTLEKVVEVFMK